MSGYIKLFWGFLFLFDFRIQGFDILPDIVSYLFFYFGSVELAYENKKFNKAKEYAITLVFLSILNIYQVQVKIEYFSFSLFNSLQMLIGTAVFILDLLMVYYIIAGIVEIAKEAGENKLVDTANGRWRLYLVTGITVYLGGIFAFIIPQIILFFVIPLLILNIIALVLMMSLMLQAHRSLYNG